MNTLHTAPPFFSQLADSVAAAHNLEELVRPLLELLQAVTGLDSTYMTRIDVDAGVQHVVYAHNSHRLRIPEGLTVPWGDTLCKRALDEGRPYTDDVAACWNDSDAARALGISTYASTPIRGQDGVLLGTLCAASDQRRPLVDGGDRVLRMFSHLIGQQVERERLMNDLRRAHDALATSALTDVLTGLPNRRSLMDELQRRLARDARDGTRLLVAFVDLDDFKRINDRHGHEAGDRFLAAIADALAGAHRAGDFSARPGGDEFVTLATVPGDPAALARGAAGALETRIREATTGRFRLGPQLEVDYAGPSIGVIVADAGSHDAEAVLKQADAAMYAIKRARKGQTH